MKSMKGFLFGLLIAITGGAAASGYYGWPKIFTFTELTTGIFTANNTATFNDLFTSRGIDDNGTENAITIYPSEEVVVSQPDSGVALSVYGANNQYATVIQGSLVNGVSQGLRIQAGTNASDVPFLVRNASNTTILGGMFGNGGMVLGSPTGSTLGLGTLNVDTGLYVDSAEVDIHTRRSETINLPSIAANTCLSAVIDAVPTPNNFCQVTCVGTSCAGNSMMYQCNYSSGLGLTLKSCNISNTAIDLPSTTWNFLITPP